MRITYGVTQDGRHVQATANTGHAELTVDQRKVLLEVFATLCEHTAAQNPTPPVPRVVGDYVLIRRGVEDGKCFADYIRRRVA